MSKIFISYAREDRPMAEAMARALEARGWPVWWDLEIRAGGTFDDVIEEALDAAECVVVIWSKRAVKSRWVRSEADEGASRGILVPVLAEPVKIPLAFRSIHAADLIGWDGSEGPELERLVADIAVILGPPPGERSAEGAPVRARAVPESPRRPASPEQAPGGLPVKVRLAIAAAAVGIVVVGVVALRAPQPTRERSADAGPAAEAPRDEAAPAAAATPKGATASGARPRGAKFRDCAGCPEMVVVPEGTFRMGSPDNEPFRDGNEGPQRQVAVARFAIGRHEVTRQEFAAAGLDPKGCWELDGGQEVIDFSKSWRNPGFSQTDADPVVCVSWEDARGYIAWLSKKAGEPYRLPSEAEWEYAARAGTTTARYWGEDPNRACSFANVADLTTRERHPTWTWEMHECTDSYGDTAPVASFQPNAFGLHDMLGNVWEWVADCWTASYAGAPRHGAPVLGGDCSRRVLRGGSWDVDPWFVRSANRAGTAKEKRDSGVGFRVARTLP